MNTNTPADCNPDGLHPDEIGVLVLCPRGQRTKLWRDVDDSVALYLIQQDLLGGDLTDPENKVYWCTEKGEEYLQVLMGAHP